MPKGELLKSASFMVTDYSSVQIDFAYMKKPLCYYHFDYEEFSEKHYHKGYFDYQADGFGPVYNSAEELVKYIEASAEKGLKNCEPYISRHKDFFNLYDTENCKRNFEAIKEKWS
jgi:CDP-glycerol glycerophosphotransferase (TagB/SpsB family)